MKSIPFRDMKILRIITLAVFITSLPFIGGCVLTNTEANGDSTVTKLTPAGDRGTGFATVSHPQYQFELQYDDFYQSEMIPTLMSIGSLIFPDSYTTGTSLSQAFIVINRTGRTCEELGYGSLANPGWHNAKSVNLDPRLKETIFVGDIEFKRMFCGVEGQVGGKVDALVYTTERNSQPLSLSLVFVSGNPGSSGLALYDPAVFENEYIKILETYKYKSK